MVDCSLRATVVVILALGLATLIKASYVTNGCLAQMSECLGYFDKFICGDEDSMLTDCATEACSTLESALLNNVLCERSLFLQKIASANVSDQCKSSLDMCEPLAYPPPTQLLYEELAYQTFCYSMSSYSVRNCLLTSPGCTLGEVKELIASACDAWPPELDPDYLKRPCQQRMMTSFNIESLPKCDANTPAIKNALSGCDSEPDKGYYTMGRLCSTFAVIEDILEKVESPHLDTCYPAFVTCVKSKLFRNGWLDPVRFYLRVCSNDEGLSTCNNTVCNAEQMVSYISHVCAPKESKFLSYACIHHAETQCLDEKSRLNCALVESAITCLLEQCNEFEVIILRREACKTLGVQGAFAIEVANKTQPCLKKIRACMQLFPFNDFFRFNASSYAAKLCIQVNSPGMRRCLTSRPGCSYEEAISLAVAACQPVPSTISIPCKEKAVECLGEAPDCDYLHNQHECLRTSCTGIESHFVITEMCPHVEVKQRLFTAIKNEQPDCKNSLETCARGMFYEKHTWKDHAEGTRFYCFFMQSKIFQMCMLKSCNYDLLSNLINIACLPAFRLLTDVSLSCQTKGGECFHQLRASTCRDIEAAEQCLEKACSTEENTRLRYFTCQRLIEMGSIIALALPSTTPPQCDDHLIGCYSHVESWINLKRPRETLCNFTASNIVQKCGTSNSFCKSTMDVMNELACLPVGTSMVTVSKGCLSGVEQCFKDQGSNPSCDVIHTSEECLRDYCNDFENKRLRQERCEVAKYIDRVKQSAQTTKDECLAAVTSCNSYLSIPIGTKSSYSERFINTCKSLLDDKTRQCSVKLDDTGCQPHEYDRIIVAGCSKDSDRMTGFSEQCINGYLGCFYMITAYRCTTVKRMQSCLKRECTDEEEKTITGGLCDTVVYVSFIMRKAVGMHGKCAKSLEFCHNLTLIEKTLWLDRLVFAKKACERATSRSFKLCVDKDCNRMYLNQYIEHVCEKRETVLASASKNVAALSTPSVVLGLFTLALQATYLYVQYSSGSSDGGSFLKMCGLWNSKQQFRYNY